MNANVAVFLIILLMGMAGWGIVQCVKSATELYFLIKARKHPENFPRTARGLVYDPSTGQVKSTTGKVCLPF